MAKLRELGWGSELDKLSWQEREEFSKLREVAQFRPLTDRSESDVDMLRVCRPESNSGSLVEHQRRMH